MRAGRWPAARQPCIVGGKHEDVPAGELDACIVHAYPEVVRTGCEMAGNRTGLLTVDVEYYAESGITGCPSPAFAAERQSRAQASGQLLYWLPGRGDRERVTAFFVTGSARRPAGRLGRRDTFCDRDAGSAISSTGPWRAPGHFSAVCY